MQGQDWKPVTWGKAGQSDSNQNSNKKIVSNKPKPTKKEQELLDEDFVPKAPPSNLTFCNSS